MTDPGLELEKYALLDAARPVTGAWPPAARVEFSTFVLEATRTELPAVDGDTPRERAANARQLARYWFRDWTGKGVGPVATAEPTKTAPQPGDAPTQPRPRTQIPAEDLAMVASWVARFGVAHALDLWRSERGRT